MAQSHVNLLTSLVLVLPLLVVYELGVQLLDVRNGADLITTALIRWLGMRGFLLSQLAVVVVIIVIAAYLRKKQQFELKRIVHVLLESTVYAATMGTVIIVFMVKVLHISPKLMLAGLDTHVVAAATQLKQAGIFHKVIMSLGAGFHEELLFRLLMMGGLLLLFDKGMGMRRPLAILFALIVSAVLFSAAHHIGPLGDPLKIGVFVYRILAGVIFGLLYHFRGFAIAVYTHAIYDIYVLIFA